VDTFGLVELEGSNNRLEDLGGNTPGCPTLEPGVVLDADAGQCGNLLPA
jgi:hypothetical protein